MKCIGEKTFMENNTVSTQAASFLDKTDWRKSIHKCLDACVFAEGTIYYPKKVQSLVSAVAAPFPNFNAKKEIDTFIEKTNKYYTKKIEEFIDKYPDYWIHPGKRLTVEPDIVNSYYKDIFEFIRDLLARKRMLLWGARRTPGGTQMEEVEY